MPGPILDLQTVKPKYKGSAEDFFRIEKIFLDSLTAERLALITLRNHLINDAWKTDKSDRLPIIKAMPDNFTRQSFHEQKHDIMDGKQVICHNLFTQLLGYIDSRWLTDQSTAASKKTEA